METVKGKYADAVIFTEDLEDYARAQIQMICDNEVAEKSKIRIMPDVHPGMVGFGYFVADNGNVYYEVMHNYMDLEYYTGPYKENERILPAVSRFVKGEIGLDFLLRIQRRLLVDMQMDGIRLENWPSNGLLEEIGLA